MVWMSAYKVERFQEETRLRKQWNQRRPAEGRRAAQKDRIQKESVPMDYRLFPGVAVVYASSVRYVDAPEGAVTIDTFDATLDLGTEVSIHKTGTAKLIQKEVGRTMETRTMLEKDIPQPLLDKLAVIHVVVSSLLPQPPSPRASYVLIPNVGVGFATGVRWVLLTSQDCERVEP